jgi:RimJ/RimL family protein N-acetyltransferase
MSKLTTLSLETPRLRLRNFCETDLEPFLAYRNDPQVYRYQGWETPYTRAKALQFLDEMRTVIPGMPGFWLQLALESKATGELLGDVAFHVLKSEPREAYIGYSLARAHWGHGYAREAVRGLLDYLFNELGLHRVVADCDVDNVASIKLLERLGFRREGHFIEKTWANGTWASDYLYAMLDREWRLR